MVGDVSASVSMVTEWGDNAVIRIRSGFGLLDGRLYTARAPIKMHMVVRAPKSSSI